MIKVPLTEDSLRAAFRRIEDFQAVHDGKDDYEEAFVILRESLGLDLDLNTILHILMHSFLGDVSDDTDFMSGVLFGIMVGLIAADYASEA